MMTATPPSPVPAPFPLEARAAPRAVYVDSCLLLQGQREILIRHGDQEYRLRHTQNDKLILTK